MTFACTTCRLVLHDGVEYSWCPKCSREVDWIDGRDHVYLCESCNELVEGTAESLRCATCFADLMLLSGPVVVDTPRGSAPPMIRAILVTLLVVQAIFALFDPHGFPYLAPLLVFVQVLALAAVAMLAFGSRELRALAGDRTTRIIHGIEHAAANVLVERGLPVLSGCTYRGQLVLDFEHTGRHYEHLETTVRDAVEDAISRIRFGERELAYHVRCGTSFLVAIALLALAIVGAGVAALAFGVPAGITFALTVGLGLVARLVARPAGLLAQRWLTVSTDFASAIVLHVEKYVAPAGDVCHATVSLDVIPRGPSVIDEAAVAPVPL